MPGHVCDSIIAVGIPLLIVAGTIVSYSAGSSGAAPAPLPVPSVATSASVSPETTSTPTAAPDDDAAAALAALDQLASAGASAPAYVRAAFGPGWGDPDRNGCDTRNDILARDLRDVVFRPGTNDCVVSTGVLDDPYTGLTISFVRGNVTSEAVQIDHVVALGWAWRYGASTWDDATRVLFANDPDNLLAVDGPTNMSKSDSGPAEWLPPSQAFHCAYAVGFVDVLAEYQLSVPAADRTALEGVLVTC